MQIGRASRPAVFGAAVLAAVAGMVAPHIARASLLLENSALGTGSVLRDSVSGTEYIRDSLVPGLPAADFAPGGLLAAFGFVDTTALAVLRGTGFGQRDGYAHFALTAVGGAYAVNTTLVTEGPTQFDPATGQYSHVGHLAYFYGCREIMAQCSAPPSIDTQVASGPSRLYGRTDGLAGSGLPTTLPDPVPEPDPLAALMPALFGLLLLHRRRSVSPLEHAQLERAPGVSGAVCVAQRRRRVA